MAKPKVLSERQWFKHTHPTSLLRHLEALHLIRQQGRRRTGRKRLVLVSALCRRVFRLLDRPGVGKPTATLITAMEQYSDGELDALELIRAGCTWRDAKLNSFTTFITITDKLGPETCRAHLTPRADDNQKNLRTQDLPGEMQRRIHLAAQAIDYFSLDFSGHYDPNRYDDTKWLLQGVLDAALAVGGYDASTELVHQCAMIRDIFGNPFHKPPKFAPRWYTSTVVQLAQQMHTTRDYAAMPILGDALMDAGCEDETILEHCRATVHVRGCWLIDHILGRK